MSGPCGAGSAEREVDIPPHKHAASLELELELDDELVLLVVEDDREELDEVVSVLVAVLLFSCSCSSFCSSVSWGLSSAACKASMNSRAALIFEISTKLSLIASVRSLVVCVRVSTRHLTALNMSTIGLPLGLQSLPVPAGGRPSLLNKPLSLG